MCGMDPEAAGMSSAGHSSLVGVATLHIAHHCSVWSRVWYLPATLEWVPWALDPEEEGRGESGVHKPVGSIWPMDWPCVIHPACGAT